MKDEGRKKEGRKEERKKGRKEERKKGRKERRGRKSARGFLVTKAISRKGAKRQSSAKKDKR